MKKRKVAVIGLGYVGLPLAIAIQKKYPTLGFDISRERIELLQAHVDITKEVSGKELMDAGDLHFSSDEKCLNDCDIYIITVPTPIDGSNRPDLGYLTDATKLVAKYLAKDDYVIYESTVYPGVTEEECIPILESVSGMKVDNDFQVGYSPERVNPGDNSKKLTEIVKVTSGNNEAAADFIAKFYSSFIDAGVFKAPSIKVAEAAKVVENIQRDVNIALMNELSILFDKLDIDTHDVIQSASSKWNFHKYEPGLVGGHCIGIDPYYLIYKSEQVGAYVDVIKSARNVNEKMASTIASKIISHLVSSGLEIKNSRVAIMGVTFKENCPDIRNSKIFDIVEILESHYLKVDLIDMIVDQKKVFHETGYRVSRELSQKYSAIIAAVKHDEFKRQKIYDIKKHLVEGGLFFDLKSMYDKQDSDFRL